jgi:potassium efflux system protein
VIVPNGTLISGQVTNWTFSGRERVIEVQVNVARTTDSQHMIDLLIKAAQTNPAILKSPAPKAYVVNMTANAMVYELRAWTDRYENWAQVRGEVSVAVNAALIQEQIPLA